MPMAGHNPHARRPNRPGGASLLSAAPDPEPFPVPASRHFTRSEILENRVCL